MKAWYSLPQRLQHYLLLFKIENPDYYEQVCQDYPDELKDCDEKQLKALTAKAVQFDFNNYQWFDQNQNNESTEPVINAEN